MKRRDYALVKQFGTGQSAENGRAGGEIDPQRGEKGGSKGDLGAFLAHLAMEGELTERVIVSSG
jgi:hypothetical protein